MSVEEERADVISVVTRSIAKPRMLFRSTVVSMYPGMTMLAEWMFKLS